MVKPFRVSKNILETNQVKRRNQTVSSKTTPKRLNKKKLEEIKKIRKERQEFLKEIGLIGKNKDKYLDTKNYKEYKRRYNLLNKRMEKIQQVQKNHVKQTRKTLYLQIYGLAYIKEKIISKIPNKALQKRYSELVDSTIRGYDMFERHQTVRYASGPNNPEKRFSRDGYENLAKANFYKYSDSLKEGSFNSHLLKLVFKKMPFINELYKLSKQSETILKNRPAQRDFEKKINELFDSIKENQETVKNNGSKKYRNLISKISNEEFRLRPNLWNKKVDELFQKRYGITLSKLSNYFPRLFNERKSIEIVDHILSSGVLNKNTLLVFPLRNSLFNYYFSRGVISEIKRLKLNKANLNAITLTSDTFKRWNSLYNMNQYIYSPTYSDYQAAPDIVTGQFENIFRKNKNVQNFNIVDFKNSGFQKGYIEHYLRKFLGEKTPNIDILNTAEAQNIEFNNKNTVSPENIVSKKVDKENKGREGYINPTQNKWILENNMKLKEMLEIAGRMILRNELKIRESN